MEDSVKGIKSQILYDWRNHFETRAQFELFIMQIDMLVEAVEKECKLTQRALDAACACGSQEFYTDKVLGVVCCRCQAPRQ